MVTNAAEARKQLLRQGHGVVVEEADLSEELPEDREDRDRRWWASLTDIRSGEVVERYYGGGTTPDEAVVRAWERYADDHAT